MRIALLAFALGAAAPAFAADVPAISPGDTLLTITAEGKSTRAPDIAGFSAGITTVGATASAAMAANAAAMTRVIDTLKAAGIADRDVQTSNLSLNPVIDNSTRDDDHPRITGYQASNTVAVRARDIGATGRIIDTLISAGANEVSGPNFELDHPEAALDEARIGAMASARSRAGLYARAAGLRVLRILSISEGGGNNSGQIMVTALRRSAKAYTPLAAGEVAANVSITAQFELAPQ